VQGGLLATSGLSNSSTVTLRILLVQRLWIFGLHSSHSLQSTFGNTFNETKRGLIEMGTPQQEIGPGEFNVFSVTDYTVYEVCLPGSGPANNNVGAGRRPGWHIKQRAFYDGNHQAFEACAKILTICLPNGMTAAVYGPTSGRQSDMALLRLSEFDDYLLD
jgi:hypothetical protein